MGFGISNVLLRSLLYGSLVDKSVLFPLRFPFSEILQNYFPYLSRANLFLDLALNILQRRREIDLKLSTLCSSLSVSWRGAYTVGGFGLGPCFDVTVYVGGVSGDGEHP